MLKEFTVLIVDDDDINRTILRHMLRVLDVTIEMAENGLVAVNYLNSNPNKDIIMLLDINMPVMNGYEVIEIVRKNRAAYSGLRTIVLSAIDHSKFKASGLDGEVYCYLQKPVDNDTLITKIKEASASNI